MARPLPLILAQTPGRPADDLAGFAADVERRVKLRAPGALVVYPELHLGESAPGAPAAPESAAEPLDGKRDAAFAELAGDLGIWLVPGSVYERGAGARQRLRAGPRRPRPQHDTGLFTPG